MFSIAGIRETSMKPIVPTRLLNCLWLSWLFGMSSVIGASPLVIDATRSCGEGLQVRIDGRPTKMSELLGRLAESASAAGVNREVLVFAKKETALGDLQNLRAFLSKIGYEKVRFYSHDEERNLISEVLIDIVGIPYTVSPPKR